MAKTGQLRVAVWRGWDGPGMVLSSLTDDRFLQSLIAWMLTTMQRFLITKGNQK
jgi:hypothetical protein